MITPEQVADLREGDVVEMSWPAEHGAQMSVRGPVVWKSRDVLTVGGYWLCQEDGALIQDAERRTLTVVSRAPRPLYVNHQRTVPVPGDVARDADEGDPDRVWICDCDGDWLNTRNDGFVLGRGDLADRLRLLVDGETGQVVP